MPEYGYAGQILKIDLSNGKIKKQPSADYTNKYIGGHGLAARLYWEMVPPQTKAADPENCFICASGPVAGFPGFAGFRWKICGKTSLSSPESFSYCNLGEGWGAILKYAGYDALVVRGKAAKPVYLYIHDGKVEIRDAAHLMGKSTFDTIDDLKAEMGDGASAITIGPAGENQVPYATVLAEGGASGSGGFAALMGSKKIKAIVAAGDKRPTAADPERVRRLVEIIREARLKMPPPPQMWNVPGISRLHACYGCGIGCSREVYPAEKGRDYKALCQASNLYTFFNMDYGGKKNGAHLLATRLCDSYGLDTIVMQAVIEFLQAGLQEGFLSEKKTGLPLSKIGSEEFIRELTRKIAFKEGFGAVLGKGLTAAADELGAGAKEALARSIATNGGEKKDYDPRLFISTALFYATEPRRPINQLHEIATLPMAWRGMLPDDKPGAMFSAENLRKAAKILWGSEVAADFSTYEGKALAAKTVQDRVYAKESLVICDLRWTMSQPARVLGISSDTVSEAQVYSAITGKEVDTAGLFKMGERVFNLQRAILLRQGRAGRKDDKILDHLFTNPLKKGELFYNADALLPGKNGEIISRVGAVVEKDKFEQMKTEYYGLRGWDAATGLPTRAKLEELKLKDVADDLAGRNLLK